MYLFIIYINIYVFIQNTYIYVFLFILHMNVCLFITHNMNYTHIFTLIYIMCYKNRMQVDEFVANLKNKLIVNNKVDETKI